MSQMRKTAYAAMIRAAGALVVVAGVLFAAANTHDPATAIASLAFGIWLGHALIFLPVEAFIRPSRPSADKSAIANAMPYQLSTLFLGLSFIAIAIYRWWAGQRADSLGIVALLTGAAAGTLGIAALMSLRGRLERSGAASTSLRLASVLFLMLFIAAFVPSTLRFGAIAFPMALGLLFAGTMLRRILGRLTTRWSRPGTVAPKWRRG